MYKTSPPKYSAKESAIYLLSRRDHGVYELAQKLATKGYEAEEVESAIQFCLDSNYLDDLRYARSQIRQHISKGNGKLRILQDLKLKRVAETDINLAFDEEEPDWYQLAKNVALKKFKGVKAKDQKEYAKQVRFLQYRGFDFEQINYALSEQE